MLNILIRRISFYVMLTTIAGFFGRDLEAGCGDQLRELIFGPSNRQLVAAVRDFLGKMPGEIDAEIEVHLDHRLQSTRGLSRWNCALGASVAVGGLGAYACISGVDAIWMSPLVVGEISFLLNSLARSNNLSGDSWGDLLRGFIVSSGTGLLIGAFFSIAPESSSLLPWAGTAGGFAAFSIPLRRERASRFRILRHPSIIGEMRVFGGHRVDASSPKR